MSRESGADEPYGSTDSIVDRVLEVWSRRKWVGIVVFVLIGAAAATVGRVLPDIYRSTATVLVERPNVSETFVKSSVTGELETRLQTISQEILSRTRLTDLILRFDLYPISRDGTSLEEAIQKMRRDILLEFKGVQQTSWQGATVALTVGYQGRDPETVAGVANALASFYVEENVRLREQQTAGTAEFLRLQLAETKKRLDEQEQRVRDFQTRHVGELPQQLAMNLATLERLHAQLEMNGVNQLRAIDRRTALAQGRGEPDPGGAAALTQDPMTAAIAKLKQELAELRGRFSDKYPDVIALKKEIADLERDLAEGKSTARAETEPATSAVPSAPLKPVLSKLDAELDALKAQEQRLRQAIAGYQRRVERAPQREQEFRALSQDYDTARELYSSLVKRYEEAQLAETMEQSRRGERFRILDPAVPPKQPVANRIRLLLVGLLLASGMAVAAVVLAEHLDTSFHRVDDLRTLTAQPVLVSIPLIVTGADRRRARSRFCFAAVSVLLALVVVIKASQHLAEGNEQLLGMLTRVAPQVAK